MTDKKGVFRNMGEIMIKSEKEDLVEKEYFETYIREVTAHVKFRFDRCAIGQELREHMEDLYEDLLSQNIDEEQAALLTVNYMGDSAELGKELNEAHNPVLGYVWLWVRRLFILIFIFFGLPAFFMGGCGALMTGYDAAETFFMDLYEEDDVVYTVDVNQKAKIDNTVFSVKKLKYHEDGTLEIRYLSYGLPFTELIPFPFSLYGCEINNGADYVKEKDFGMEQEYHVQGLYWDMSVYLEDFPADSNWCNIIYENGERSFTMEIPLPQKEGTA